MNLVNYNFLVKSDSLTLLSSQPEELLSELQVDTFAVRHSERLVVSDIRIIPNDSIDSIWVEVANVQALFGWLRKSEMLNNVVPDDPISLFINWFSTWHTPIFLSVILLVAGALTWYYKARGGGLKHRARSYYALALIAVTTVSSLLYSIIQVYYPAEWEAFYIDPTLNPFTQSALLASFLTGVWAIIILAIATIEEVIKLFPLPRAVLYLASIVATCMLSYLICSDGVEWLLRVVS